MKKNIFVSFLMALLVIPAMTQAAVPNTNPSKDNYKIDTSKSNVKWTGKSVRGGHFGDINIKEGSFTYNGKTISAGTVVMDMNSISVKDLEDPNRQNRLANHLKSDDFFSSEKFPESKLVITGSKAGKTAGEIEVTGDLTIKGITKPVTFPVKIKSSGKNVEAEGLITVDRIQYDIKYRSKSVLDPSALADRLIYDEFTLEFKVTASK